MKINKTAADRKLIRMAVANEVDNVRSILKDLLAKKLAFYDQQEQSAKEQLPLMASKKLDFGSYYNTLLQSLDDIATELGYSVTTETVRRVRGLLSDIKGKLPSMTSGEVKMVLDTLFCFVPYTGIKLTRKSPSQQVKYDKEAFTLSGTKGDDKKAKESRRLIQEIVLKFVHQNSIQYLQADLYPSEYIEDESLMDQKGKELEESIQGQKKYRRKALEARAQETEVKMQDSALRTQIKDFEKQMGGPSQAYFAVVETLKANEPARTYKQIIAQLMANPDSVRDAMVDIIGRIQRGEVVVSSLKAAANKTAKFMKKAGAYNLLSEPDVQNLNVPLDASLAQMSNAANPEPTSFMRLYEKAKKILDDPDKSKVPIMMIPPIIGKLTGRKPPATIGTTKAEMLRLLREAVEEVEQ